MKNFSAFKKLFSLAVSFMLISGCSMEPVQPEQKIVKGAPEWVNKGNVQLNKDGRRLFVGVASSNPHGDLAMQKASADDRSLAQVSVVLSHYMDALSIEYMNVTQLPDNGFEDDAASRQLSDAAKKQVLDGVIRQIDDTVARQFKEKVSRQFKDDVTRQINEAAYRTIRDGISSQLDFSIQLDRIISDQIKVVVLRQIKNTMKTSMVGTRIAGNWRDPSTGVLWSLAELDLKQVKSAIAAAPDINIGLKNFVETNAEFVFDNTVVEQEGSESYFFK